MMTGYIDSFITVKDHEQQFINNQQFRLTNPIKSKLVMVSKKMLTKIIETVKIKSHLLQWKNSDSVIFKPAKQAKILFYPV